MRCATICGYGHADSRGPNSAARARGVCACKRDVRTSRASVLAPSVCACIERATSAWRSSSMERGVDAAVVAAVEEGSCVVRRVGEGACGAMASVRQGRGGAACSTRVRRRTQRHPRCVARARSELRRTRSPIITSSSPPPPPPPPPPPAAEDEGWLVPTPPSRAVDTAPVAHSLARGCTRCTTHKRSVAGEMMVGTSGGVVEKGGVTVTITSRGGGGTTTLVATSEKRNTDALTAGGGACIVDIVAVDKSRVVIALDARRAKARRAATSLLRASPKRAASAARSSASSASSSSSIARPPPPCGIGGHYVMGGVH